MRTNCPDIETIEFCGRTYSRAAPGADAADALMRRTGATFGYFRPGPSGVHLWYRPFGQTRVSELFLLWPADELGGWPVCTLLHGPEVGVESPLSEHGGRNAVIGIGPELVADLGVPIYDVELVMDEARESFSVLYPLGGRKVDDEAHEAFARAIEETHAVWLQGL